VKNWEVFLISTNNRLAMIKALKITVVSYLREHGFKGAFPHFRRQKENHIDLITFQFNRYGGSFVVELAFCPAEGITTSWGEHISPKKVTAHDVNERYRLNEDLNDASKQWFHFENAIDEKDYEQVASEVKQLLHRKIE
jgi:hypothetical protein